MNAEARTAGLSTTEWWAVNLQVRGPHPAHVAEYGGEPVGCCAPLLPHTPSAPVAPVRLQKNFNVKRVLVGAMCE